MRTCVVGVGGDLFIGFEVQVAFNRQIFVCHAWNPGGEAGSRTYLAGPRAIETPPGSDGSTPDSVVPRKRSWRPNTPRIWLLSYTASAAFAIGITEVSRTRFLLAPE